MDADRWTKLPVLEVADDRTEIMRLVEDTFTAEWLNSGSLPVNPLQQLWQTAGHVQATELYILGKTLKHIKPLMSPRAWGTIERYIKGNDEGLRAGAMFELVSALLVTSPGQQVSMPPSGQPGYDILVKVGNKSLRISCKALLPSVHERKFNSFAVLVQGVMRQVAQPDRPSHMSLALLDHTDNFKYDVRILPRFAEAYHQWHLYPHDKPFFGHKIGGWFAQFSELGSSELPFMPGVPSYSLLVAAEFAKDEQRRFDAKMTEAVENLGKHCRQVDNTVTNLIFIRLPNAVSLGAAKLFAARYWEEARPAHIAGVFFFRTKVTTTRDLQTSAVTWESGGSDNPHAASPLRQITGDQGLKMTVPFGLISDAEQRLLLFVNGQEALDLTFRYSLIAAQRHYDARSLSTVEMLRLPFTATTYHLSVGQDILAFSLAEQNDELKLL